MAADLSDDQRLMYRYSRAVDDGVLSADLARTKPGPLNHARWLTPAIRVLVLYTRTATPTPALASMATFIQQVYVPVWFGIRSRPTFVHGHMHLFRLMQLVTAQPGDVQQAVRSTVEPNAYFAHPENLLVAMVSDSYGPVLDQGVSRLLAARKQELGATASKRRQFRVPALNWEAQSYPSMIKWEEVNVTEPSVTAVLPDSAIEAVRDQPLEFPGFPCHALHSRRSAEWSS